MIDFEKFIRDRQDAIRGRKETWREKVVARIMEIDWESTQLLMLMTAPNLAIVATVCFLAWVATRS